MINIRSLDDVVMLRESVSLECKAAQGRDGKGHLPEDFWPTYSAMANTDGGTVILGLREHKNGRFEVVGIADPAKVRSSLFTTLNNHNKVNKNLLKDNDVQELTIEKKNESPWR